MKEKKLCKSCRWFVAWHEGDSSGRCFYNSPTIIQEDGLSTRCERPIVAGSDFYHTWCEDLLKEEDNAEN